MNPSIKRCKPVTLCERASPATWAYDIIRPFDLKYPLAFCRLNRLVFLAVGLALALQSGLQWM